MRVANWHIYHVRIPLKKTIRHASHTRKATDSLIVRCTLDTGQTGWGEGLPREYVTGENIDAAFAMLRELPNSATLHASFENEREAVRTASNWDIVRPSNAVRACYGNSARCAMELAFLDAIFREVGRPLSELPAMTNSLVEHPKIRKRVRYSGAITAESAKKQLQQAVKMRLFGFHQVKVKVGVSEIDDATSLKTIRRIVGRKVDLRIDANEAWQCSDVVRNVERLSSSGITSVEQPVPHSDVVGLSKIRPQLSVPIMLDESLCHREDAVRAYNEGLCDLFNIRLSKCGGILPSLELKQMAVNFGLGFQLGCQVGETGILSAAGRHIACAIEPIRYLEGSYDRFLVKEPLTKENLTFGYGGRARAINRPGLGVIVDEAALSRVTIREHSQTVH
ncbi:dipeptide epimerase [Thalassoroseus pseudoceratinae]|uniref:dipeptide epimerase n=1 Tax=Thalassoroseus pseudoceratinae TaxID=2713176 RepID=UPI00142414E4|nr:dipeptide epimerase [Thalassoroseus pseudoceratinae]